MHMEVITAAVEGIVDEAVVRRLAKRAGLEMGSVYGKNGKDHLRQRIGGYNNAARFSLWIILVDLNFEAECAPPLRNSWLPQPADKMCFRVAVRKVESWLLGDRERIAKFLRVRTVRIPPSPDALPDPRDAMLALAAQSRRLDIREDMLPRPGSGRPIGPAYTSRMIEFVENYWRPEVAARSSDSLRRCLTRLGEIARGGQ